MTEYNGQSITYDKIGNPLTYRDGMTMTWKRGRQLTTLQTEENSIQYKYDSDSIRTSKIVDGVVHTYEYLDGLLMHETRGEQAYDYYYDANGQLHAVSYKLSETDSKKVYYFTHNWRGDIVGIYNGNGDLKATYEYDAWGNVIAIEDADGNAITSATHIANLNPFRYRGYFMDTETGLYYLMSRYYDPVTHRFVNADGYFQSGGDILDTNMNAYCRNNPVNCFDPTGSECEVHKPGYVPNCEICSPFFADYKKMQRAIARSTENKNFTYYHKNGYTNQNDESTSFLGFGTYAKEGYYDTIGSSGKIMSVSTFYDSKNAWNSSFSIESKVASLTFGLDDMGFSVGIPWDGNFYGVESSLSITDGFVRRIGFTNTIASPDGYSYTAIGGGIEYNQPLAGMAVVLVTVGGPYLAAGAAGLMTYVGQSPYILAN